MRLADEILLLLTDDETGAMTVPEALLDRAVAAGALADLEAAGLVAVADVDGEAPDGSGVHVTAGRLALTAASAEEVADPVLAATVSAYRALQGRPVVATLAILGRALYPVVHRALAADGVLVREAPATPRSMRPSTTWPTADPGPEQAARSILRRVLSGAEATPEERRHARLVVVLLAATGTLDAALAACSEEVRSVARNTEAPIDAGPAYSAVVRALHAD